MKHTSQIPEETVNRFINESMKTKTMLEAKKKAKNFDYSNEGGAGKRERQEMEEPQGGKKESKWSKFKKAMNNAAERVTSGDSFIRDTGMKMDHQEHEGDGVNELTSASNPNSWTARAIASRNRKVAGMNTRRKQAAIAANRLTQPTGGKTGAGRTGVPPESDSSWATAGSDAQVGDVRAGSPKGITPNALGPPGQEVRKMRTQIARSIKRVRADHPESGAMGAEGPGTGVPWGGQLPTDPKRRGEIAKRAISLRGRFRNRRRIKRAQKAFKN